MSRIHVLPINDTYEHEEATWCPCKPRIEDDRVIHNSFDGREHNESDHDWKNCDHCINKRVEAKQ